MNEEQIQQELFDDFFRACDNADLIGIKDVMSKINLKSTFHQKNQSSRKFFIYACLSGNLDIVDEIATLALSCRSKKPIINEAFKFLIESHNEKTYPIISYLTNHPKFKNKHDDNFDYTFFNSLKDAAKNDDLNLFKALIDLNHSNKDHYYLFSIGYISLINNVCSNNNIEIFKYIYDYRLVIDPRDIEFGFSQACNHCNTNILNFLIFDKKIPKTERINESIEIYKCIEAEKMFQARELQGELNSNKLTIKKNKI
jgi:hypothetical protein